MPFFGRDTQPMQCPYCHFQISTKIDTQWTCKTHMAALCLFIFLCWPCICVPYCCRRCKRVDHYCPNCGQYLGTA